MELMLLNTRSRETTLEHELKISLKHNSSSASKELVATDKSFVHRALQQLTREKIY